MSVAGHPAYNQLLAVLEKSDQPDTQTQKDVADFISQFEAKERYGVLYFLEAALTAPALHMRQMAALCLKRAINVRWVSLEPDIKTQLKAGLVRGIQIDDSEVRTMFGSAFVALFAVEGYEHWPEAPGLLLKLLKECPNEIVRETAGSTLLMLVEDMTSCDARMDDQTHSNVAWEHFLNFVAKELLPSILELAAKVPSSLSFSCKMLSSLMDVNACTKPLFEQHFVAFWTLLGSIAHNRDPWVRKCVLKGMVETWTRHPMTILDASTAVFRFVIDCTGDSSDYTAQIEALHFWAQLLKNRLDEPIRVRMVESLRVHLPQLIPVLMEHTKYSSWDYMSMDESHFEEDNAAVPDRVEDVPPRPECEMSADEDEESATWGTNWTARKGSALALDYISQVYGHDKEILQYMLELIERRLGNETDWEIRESAVLVLGAIARGCALAMAPFLPKVVQYLIDLTHHSKPLMRSIACWCLSRYAGWACQAQREPHEEPWLEPVLNAVLRRVLDRNKRVQEAACSALAAFIEDGGSKLVPYLQRIVETVVQALGFYQARNLMFLYDTIGTMGQIFGEALPQSPCGQFLMHPVIQRLGTTETHTPEFLALMDCVASLAQCWQLMFACYAEVTLRRAMNAVFEVLYDAKVFEMTDGASDLPRWDIIGCALDVISTVVSSLQEQSWRLVETLSVTVDPSVAKQLGMKQQQVYLSDMIMICCQCPTPEVLQSISALVGDFAWHSTALVATDPVIMSLNLHLSNPSRVVCNNVCWSLGVLSQTSLGKQRLEPYFHELFPKLVQLLKCETELLLMQNICVTIGFFVAAYPELTAPHLPHFLQPWLEYISRSRNDPDKAQSLAAVVQVAARSAELTGAALLALTRVALDYPPWCNELEASIRVLAQRLAQSPAEWNSLTDAERAQLRERASGDKR
ncbi:Transportin-2 [Babesia sp. Xinjiang]|uniref:Transportin-2 n=1 Tax=Babesia sp. Xinjiang TaxID=462227 RepID=UPI000A24806E|nr:Transportin-2 [Babesia sp. Xinjiang]ORM40699.1 Transportin-2 [Babesia sp. Xinjiang]